MNDFTKKLNDENVKQLMTDLSTSPDFLSALNYCYQNMDEHGLELNATALFFFSEGYLSCLDFQKQKMCRPYKYNPKGNANE